MMNVPELEAILGVWQDFSGEQLWQEDWKPEADPPDPHFSAAGHLKNSSVTASVLDILLIWTGIDVNDREWSNYVERVST